MQWEIEREQYALSLGRYPFVGGLQAASQGARPGARD
jgi:hypothetical protein